MPGADHDSQGGWSDPGASTPAPVPAIPAQRYEVGALIGQGGMGAVYAAHDRLLDRQVALKVATSAEGASRLAREASVTARLDHPGIVAVFDAGALPGGNRFYTMHLVRGQTLQQAMETTTSRRDLVRHLLHAAEAVAAAHEAGMVHRDLKPANVLIGAHGETQVVDWGLASPTALDAARWAGLGSARGGGTARYASPEQARGGMPDPRDDVYSLGVMLRELFPADRPAEIEAICGRATHREPSERYPDASAFADDLLRWFEGRRVRAHAYSPADLLRRSFEAYRLPILVGALGAVAVSVAVATGWWKTTQSLRRAVAAEAVAHESRRRATSALADLRVEEAVEATLAGDRPRAERLAAAVLAVRDDPAARGVLAAFGRSPRAELERVVSGPACTWSALAPRGAWLACGTGTRIERWDGDVRTWSVAAQADLGEVQANEVRAVTPDARTLVLDAATGRVIDDLAPLSPPAGPVVGARRPWTPTGDFPALDDAPCSGPPRAAAVAPTGRSAIACADGRLWIGGGSAVDTDLSGDHEVASLLVHPGGVVLGSIRGALRAYDWHGHLLGASALSGGSVSRLAIDDKGSRVAASGQAGGVWLWDIATGATAVAIPATGVQSLAFDGDTLVVHGEGLSRWRLPRGKLALVRAPVGLADVAAHPREAEAVAVGGNGHVIEVSASVRRSLLGEGLLKSVSLHPDTGRAAITSMATPWLYDDDHPPPPAPIRRLAHLAEGHRVAIGMPNGLWHAASGAWTRLEDGAFVDLEGDGQGAVALASNGALWSVDERGARVLAERPGARAVAIRGDTVVVATESRIEILGRDLVLHAGSAALTDIALDRDRRRLAAGTLDGRVLVWSLESGVLLGILPGHAERVSAVDFLAGGDIVSVSWDKSVRLWARDALDRPASELAATIATAWPNPEPE